RAPTLVGAYPRFAATDPRPRRRSLGVAQAALVAGRVRARRAHVDRPRAPAPPAPLRAAHPRALPRPGFLRLRPRPRDRAAHPLLRIRPRDRLWSALAVRPRCRAPPRSDHPDRRPVVGRQRQDPPAALRV